MLRSLIALLGTCCIRLSGTIQDLILAGAGEGQRGWGCWGDLWGPDHPLQQDRYGMPGNSWNPLHAFLKILEHPYIFCKIRNCFVLKSSVIKTGVYVCLQKCGSEVWKVYVQNRLDWLLVWLGLLFSLFSRNFLGEVVGQRLWDKNT